MKRDEAVEAGERARLVGEPVGYVVVDNLGNVASPTHSRWEDAKRLAKMWDAAPPDLYHRPRLGVRYTVVALVPVNGPPRTEEVARRPADRIEQGGFVDEAAARRYRLGALDPVDEP